MFIFLKKYKYLLGFFLLLALQTPLLRDMLIEYSQEYLSKKLQKKVLLQSFHYYPPQAEFVIEDKENLLTLNLNNISPIRAEAFYDGDLAAFSNFVSLQGKTQIKADILYDEFFYIDAATTLYNSNTSAKIDNKNNQWNIRLDIKHFDLEEFKKSNDYNFALDGNLTTKAILHYTDENNISKLNFLLEPQSLRVDSYHIKQPLNIKGNLQYDTYMQLEMHLEQFGSKISLYLQDQNISLSAPTLEVEEVLAFIKEKPYAQGKINLSLKGDFNKLTFSLQSPSLKTNKKLTSLNQLVQAKVEGTYDLRSKHLASDFQIRTPYKNETIKIQGKVKYAKNLFLQASTKSFDTQTKFHLYDKKFTLVSKDLNISKLLSLFGQKQYARGIVELKADGNFQNFNFTLDADKLNTPQTKLPFNVKIYGNYKIKEKLLNSRYIVELPLEKELVHVRGNLSYDNIVSLDGKSDLFGSQTSFQIHDKHLDLKSKHFQLSRLSSLFLEQKKIYGDLNISLHGTLDNFQAEIKTDNFRKKGLAFGLDKKTKIDLKLNYTPKLITLKPRINNTKIALNNGSTLYDPQLQTLNIKHHIILHYKKKKVPIAVALKTSLHAPYDSTGTILHKDDHILIKTFSYENGVIKSDFDINIKELSLYDNLTNQNLHGPLNIQARYKTKFELTTDSFGGNFHLSMQDEIISTHFTQLELPKIMHLVGKDFILDKGKIDGSAQYNLKNSSATTDIKITNTQLKGIDLDRDLLQLKNTMGLNILSLGKNALKNFRYSELKTDISHLQCDVVLKDKQIHLQDLALKTKHFRLVALGDIYQDGRIKDLQIHIVDKKGCSFLRQDFQGNIKDPKLASTSSTALGILESTPNSILSTGRKIIDFGADTIDSTASFAIQTSRLSDRNISLTRSTINKGDFVLQGTKSYIPLQSFQECKVVYDGKVKDTF